MRAENAGNAAAARRAPVALLTAFVAAGATASAHGADRPDVHAGSALAFYADGMKTFVWTPHVSAGTTFSNGLSLDATWDLDVITSASVDVVTAATAKMTDERNVLDGTLSWAPNARFVGSAGYTYSKERDFDSHLVHASLKNSFFGDRLDAAVNYSVAFTRAGIRKEPRDLWRPATLHAAEVLASFVVDRHMLLDVVYSWFFATGYLANPYRRVPVVSSADLRDALWLDEAVPSNRWRNAVTLRARRGFGADVIGTAEYRFYWDDWGLLAHMVAAGVTLTVAESMTLEFRARGSFQDGASFYEERYNEVTVYRTRDRRLSPHQAFLGGAALFWDVGPLGPLGNVDLRLGLDGLAWHYPRYLAPGLTFGGDPVFEPLGWVPGLVAHVGLEVEL